MGAAAVVQTQEYLQEEAKNPKNCKKEQRTESRELIPIANVFLKKQQILLPTSFIHIYMVLKHKEMRTRRLCLGKDKRMTSHILKQPMKQL